MQSIVQVSDGGPAQGAYYADVSSAGPSCCVSLGSGGPPGVPISTAGLGSVGSAAGVDAPVVDATGSGVVLDSSPGSNYAVGGPECARYAPGINVFLCKLRCMLLNASVMSTGRWNGVLYACTYKQSHACWAMSAVYRHSCCARACTPALALSASKLPV